MEEIAKRNPAHVAIELTTRCNAKCLMCRHHYRVFGQEMDKALVDKILRDATTDADRVELCGLGEPFLSPHFRDLFDAFTRKGVCIDTTTNGTLLDSDEIVSKIVRSRTVLSLSLDGARKETFERYRPTIAWEDMLRILERIRFHAQAARSEKRFIFQFFMVGMRGNIDDLAEMVRLAAEYGAGSVTLNILDNESEYWKVKDEPLRYAPGSLSRNYRIALKEARRLNIDLCVPPVFIDLIERYRRSRFPFAAANRARSALGRAKEFLARRRNGRALRRGEPEPDGSGSEEERHAAGSPFAGSPHTRENVSKITGAACHWPWNDACIGVDGQVRPCYSYGEIVGDLTRQEWSEIWNGALYRSFRRTIHSWNPPYACRVCPFSFGITGGDREAYRRFFGRFRSVSIPLSSPDLECEGVLRAEGGSDARCANVRVGSSAVLRLPPQPGARFLRLRIVARSIGTATTAGVCVVNGAAPEPFDDSGEAVHFPLFHAAGDRLEARLTLEGGAGGRNAEAEASLTIVGVDLLH